MASYKCKTCGVTHDDLPHIGADKPDPWFDVPALERPRRCVVTPDTCIIDNTHYFIRGVIEIPILDDPHGFGFGAWISQKKENFLTYAQHPDTDQIGPFFGWLCTNLHCYPLETRLLKTQAVFRGGGIRPRIDLEPTDHPLALDQRNGITLARAWEIVHFYTDRSRQ